MEESDDQPEPLADQSPAEGDRESSSGGESQASESDKSGSGSDVEMTDKDDDSSSESGSGEGVEVVGEVDMTKPIPNYNPELWPDNQLGLLPSDHEKLSSCDGDDESPPEGNPVPIHDENLSREDKLKNFWKKFERPFPRPSTAASSRDLPPGAPHGGDSQLPEPMPEDSVDELTREEKVKKFWEKYQNARTRMEEVGMDLPDVPPGCESNSESEAAGDSSHGTLSQSTLRLSEAGQDEPAQPAVAADSSDESSVGGEPEGKKSMKYDTSDGGVSDDGGSSDTTSSGGKSDVSLRSVVDEATFLDAMGSESKEAHKKSLMSEASTSSTLQTPKCAKPNFWGFPLVETPPKTSVLWFCHGMFFLLGWDGVSFISTVFVLVSNSPAQLFEVCVLCVFAQAFTSNKKKKKQKVAKVHGKSKASGSKAASISKKASFSVSAASSSAGLKAKDVKKAAVTYATYDISMLPQEAYPDGSRRNAGFHSYTLGDGSASVEVLLQKEAFFVKKVGPKGTGPVGQVSWTKNNGVNSAWEIAKTRSGLTFS